MSVEHWPMLISFRQPLRQSRSWPALPMNAPSFQALAHPYSFTTSVKATVSLAPYLQTTCFSSLMVRACAAGRPIS